ncbi:MAG TPA: efflux RND transporter periplasmic adaptor subunit [Magnetovibrio sp.]
MNLQPAHKTAIIIAVLAIAWMASGVFKTQEPAIHEVQHQSDTPAAVRVRVATLQSQHHTPTIELLGRTQAGQAVSVRAEVTGRVLEIVAEKGQTVEAGTVLLRIDDEDRPQLLNEAKARLKQREIAYESAKKLSKGGYSSQLNVAQALADLEAARAAVTRFERNLANITITAPFAGVVDDIPVEVGDYFDKAGQVAARVLDLSTIKAVGQVAERDISRVFAGGVAVIKIPSGRELQGRVTFVGMSSDALTRTFPVEVTAEVAERDVPEGVTAQIQLPLEEIKGHFISPALLTLDEQGQIGVKTVNDEDRVEFHAVHLASDTMGGAWLTGLPDTLRIITVGQEFVNVGTQVVPVDGPLPTSFSITEGASVGGGN